MGVVWWLALIWWLVTIVVGAIVAVLVLAVGVAVMVAGPILVFTGFAGSFLALLRRALRVTRVRG